MGHLKFFRPYEETEAFDYQHEEDSANRERRRRVAKTAFVAILRAGLFILLIYALVTAYKV